MCTLLLHSNHPLAQSCTNITEKQTNSSVNTRTIIKYRRQQSTFWWLSISSIHKHEVFRMSVE